jgi:Cu(I)/Ag(I) efflux system membrane fusion protein
MVQEGDYVMQGQALFKIANLKTVWAVFDAYERQLPALEEGQAVDITTNAYPNKSFSGRISLIEPTLDAKRRIIKVRTELANESGMLKPGMFVAGRIDVASTGGEASIMVPSTAVMWTGERSLVYVKPNPADPVFEMREVTLGRSSGDMEQVIEGLRPGEEIVVNGTFTVDAAAQLQGKKSMMNPEGGKTMTGHEGHGAMAPANHETHSPMPEEFSNTITRALPDYLEMKDALVAGDKALVSEKAHAVLNIFDEKKLQSSAGLSATSLKQMLDMAAHIAAAGTIEEQRKHFEHFNLSWVPLVRNAGSDGNTLYIQHCPMAGNNKGAYWISADKEIRNPYYGNEMLNCGSVTDSIK